ncbi:hypothetical protein EES47_03590 [Streptomyces sp. ADI98-12]|nr:hypothetical protein EES47_03590 [Streptomyces sp. ADI98-12]
MTGTDTDPAPRVTARRRLRQSLTGRADNRPGRPGPSRVRPGRRLRPSRPAAPGAGRGRTPGGTGPGPAGKPRASATMVA